MLNPVGQMSPGGMAGQYAARWASLPPPQTSSQGMLPSPGSLPGKQTTPPKGLEPCQTCQNRVYQDQSNDPGVSFKMGGGMNPAQAAALVPAHEQEHVGREKARAQEAGGEVISQRVRIFTDKCPECGKVYVSGGETVTVTSYPLRPQANLLDLRA